MLVEDVGSDIGGMVWKNHCKRRTEEKYESETVVAAMLYSGAPQREHSVRKWPNQAENGRTAPVAVSHVQNGNPSPWRRIYARRDARQSRMAPDEFDVRPLTSADLPRVRQLHVRLTRRLLGPLLTRSSLPSSPLHIPPHFFYSSFFSRPASVSSHIPAPIPTI